MIGEHIDTGAQIAILILAAGASSRMKGRDKLLEQVDGMPLLGRQALRAQASGCAVLVALPPPPHDRYAVLEGLSVTPVPVADAAEGINASLRAGLAAVSPHVNAVMVLLADMPDITENDIESILQAVDLKSENLIWRATTDTGKGGHPIVFHRQLFADLSALRGDEGGSPVVKANRARTLDVPLPDTHARLDLDTPEAWAQWRALRKAI